MMMKVVVGMKVMIMVIMMMMLMIMTMFTWWPCSPATQCSTKTKPDPEKL